MLTSKRIFWFWLPLALMWFIMSAEQPAITAVVSRLPDATLNLAAFGLTFAFALIVESPVIMLLTAATALATHRQSFNKLLNYTHIMAGSLTLLHLLLPLTPAYAYILREWVQVPEEVIEPSRQAFLVMFPWTPMIAYRRLFEGVMIRYGRPQRVTMVIVVRLAASIAVLLAGLGWGSLNGAVVGGLSLSVGVTVGALAAWWLALPTLREIPATGKYDEILTWAKLNKFYLPLALTTFITMVANPIVAFGLSRAAMPLESLAIWPVVTAVTFIGRSVGMAFQEVGVALLREPNAFAPLRRFAWILAATASGVFLLFAVTPMARWWYGNISGLTPELVELAIMPTILLALIPGLTAMIAWYRAVLVTHKHTTPISGAVALNMVILSGLIMILPMLVSASGAVIAAVAFSASLLAEGFFLWQQSEQVERRELPVQQPALGD